MEELQKSPAREAVAAAQAQLDHCTAELQTFTKATGDAFSKLGQAESSWSHARTVIMSWATVLSLIGSFLGLLLSFQVTKMRIETSVERTKQELVELLDKRDLEKADAAARTGRVEAPASASASAATAGGGAGASDEGEAVNAEVEGGVASSSGSRIHAGPAVDAAEGSDREAGEAVDSVVEGGVDSSRIDAGPAVDTAADAAEGNDRVSGGGEAAAALGTNAAAVAAIDDVARRIEALAVAAERLETVFAGLQAAMPNPPLHQQAPLPTPTDAYGGVVGVGPSSVSGWSRFNLNLGAGESFLLLSLTGAIVVRMLDAAANR